MRIILLGAPGVGKGTQAKLISEHFNIPHISTGDIFRSNISHMTPLGIQAKEYMQRGQLVPDSLTIAVVKDRLKQEDSLEGFLLDGFPRSIHQARELDLMLMGNRQHVDKVFNIYIPEELIIKRITGRRFCTSCGSSFHINFNPSKTEGKCDTCGAELIQRDDDRSEIVKDRLAVYHRSTRPLIDYYNSTGVLYNVSGDSDIKDVFHSISNSLRAV